MKRFYVGLILGLIVGLILATTTFVFAEQPIKLIINGKQIQCDVPPQNIDGRVLVPARFLAEALGAKVEWDATDNAVLVTSITPSPCPEPKPEPEPKQEPEPEPEQVKVTPIRSTTPEGYTRIGEKTETKDTVRWKYDTYDSEGNKVGGGGGGGGAGQLRNPQIN
jgi:hypothetical protein